jgi:hypothetical protein
MIIENNSQLNKRSSAIDLYIALLLLVLTLFLGYLLMVPGVCGVYHDDGIYVISAKALAEGQGYRIISLPQAPFQSKYPIVYPAMLTMIWKLWPTFPANITIMQWMTLTFAGIFVGLAYLYLVVWGYASRSVAFLAGILIATSSNFLYYGILTLSEMPFACFMVAAMFALERYLVNPRTGIRLQLGLGVILALPLLTRAIGIVFIPAALAVIYSRRRPMFWVILGILAVAGPWIMWSILTPIWNESIITGWYTDYLGWWKLSSGQTVKINILLTNLLMTCVYMVCQSLVVLIQAMRVEPQLLIFIAFLGFLSLVWLAKDLRRKPILPAFLCCYLLLTICWPWPPARRLIVILPFLMAFLLSGLLSIISMFTWLKKQRFLGVVFAALLVTTNLVITYQNIQTNQKAHYPFLSSLEKPVSWSSYEEIFRWVKANTQPSAIIAYGLDSMLFLYTGRQGFRPFVVQPETIFYGSKKDSVSLRDLQKSLAVYQPSYLINTPMPNFGEERPFTEMLQKLQERYPEWLETVYQGSDPRFVIFKIHAHRAPS